MREELTPVEIEDELLAHGFVQTPVAVLFDHGLSPGAKTTYSALLWYAWKWGGAPAQAVMAEQLGAARRTIQGHLYELQKAGYIEIQIRGLGRPNKYVIKSLRGREFPDAQIFAHQVRNELRIRCADFCAPLERLETDDTRTNDNDSSDGSNGDSDSFIEEIARRYGRDKRDAKALATSLKKYPLEAVRWAVQELQDGLSEIANPGAWLNAVVPQLAEELQERKREQINKKQQDLMIIRATAGLFRRVDPPERVIERLCEAWPEELVREALGRTSE